MLKDRFQRLRCERIRVIDAVQIALGVSHARGAPMNALTWQVRRLAVVDDACIEGLTDVLIDCVEGGASVSFMHPLTRERAAAFWRRVAAGVAAGQCALLVAEDAHGVCGTVQLVLEQPENQPHRADLRRCSFIGGHGVTASAPRCCARRRRPPSTAAGRCWCSIRQAPMPSVSTSAPAGSESA